MQISKIVLLIPFFINCISIFIVFGKKPSTEQKYVLSIAFSDLFFLAGFILFALGSGRLPFYGLKVVFISSIVLLAFFYQFISILFNVRIPRRIWLITSLLIIFLIWGVSFGEYHFHNTDFMFKSYGYEYVDILHRTVLCYEPGTILFIYYGYAAGIVVLTVLFFVYRIITCKKHERIFYVRNFVLCIIPVCSFIFTKVDFITFYILPYAIPLFIVTIVILILCDNFTNLSDRALSTVENAVPGPCFILDENLMVHDANAMAVELFPEYASLCKVLKKPAKANALLEHIIFQVRNNASLEYDVFESGDKQYIAQCIEVKSNHHLYGYTVVLKDVTEHSDEVLKLEDKINSQRQLLRCYEDEISAIQSKVVSGAIQLVISSDRETGEHMRRISNYINVIARQMMIDGKYRNILTERYIEMLIKVSPLHDIGKLKTAQYLISKFDTRSIVQESEVRKHVITGIEVVDALIVNNEEDLFYRLAKEVVMYHHEWWDGEGYPKGLMRQEIPLSARIVAVADVFDNISFQYCKESKNPDFTEVFDSIVAYSNKRFDPEIIDSFKNAKSKIQRLYEEIVLSDLTNRNLNGEGGRWQ